MMVKNIYAKLLVGKYEGQTLNVKEITDNTIIIRHDFEDNIYVVGEYEFIPMYPRAYKNLMDN